MRLLLTRPQHESDALAQILCSQGHEVLVEPLLSIVVDHTVMIGSENPQAILVTSVNGARALSAHHDIQHYTGVPVFAVGQATADALGGFNVVHVGSNGVAGLFETICAMLEPTKGSLLYVRGVHVAGTLTEDLRRSGYRVNHAVLYEAIETTLFSTIVIQRFLDSQIDGVVLFSPRTAAVFSTLVEKAGLSIHLEDVTFYCLSQNVSDSLQLSEIQVRDQTVISSLPTQESLISAIQLKRTAD